MPRFNLTINSEFKPYSFDELIKPYQIYGQEYKEQESAYSDLGTLASVWEKLANSEKDKEQYQVYKNYYNSVKQAADELATKGLSQKTRTSVRNLRNAYAAQIQPISDAWNAREEDIKEFNKNASKHMIYGDATPWNTGLGAYMAGRPEYQVVDGDQLYNRGVSAGKGASLRRYSSAEARAFKGMYYDLIEKQGYNEAEAAAFLADRYSIPELAQSIANISNEYNTNKLGNNQNKAIDAIVQGVFDGMTYGEKHNLHENKIATYNATHPSTGTTGGASFDVNVRTRYNARKRSDQEKLFAKFLRDNYIEYNADGTLRLTEKGKEKYKEDSKRDEKKEKMINSTLYTPARLLRTAGQDDSNLYAFLNSDNEDGSRAVELEDDELDTQLNAIINQMNWQSDYNQQFMHATAGDAFRRGELAVSPDNAAEWKKQIMESAGASGLREVEYNEKTGKYEETGKTQPVSVLGKDKAEVINIIGSDAGLLFSYKDEEGNIHYAERPEGLYAAKQYAERQAYQDVAKYENMALEAAQMGNDAAYRYWMDNAKVAWKRAQDMIGVSPRRVGVKDITYGRSKGDEPIDEVLYQ